MGDRKSSQTASGFRSKSKLIPNDTIAELEG